MESTDLLELLAAPATRLEHLRNGLAVVVRPLRTSPVVAIMTHIRAGYFDEEDAVAGISHVLEHMLFKGTPRRGPGEMAREIKAAGGYVNASTSYDHTRYYTVLPAASFEQGMEVQADAVRNSMIDADELARELRVIIEEARRKRDTPTAMARETLYANLFDVHRMRRWRIGTEEQLSGYGRDDVLGFYREHYRPDVMVLAIAGDVEEDQAIALAEKAYGDMPAGRPPPSTGPSEPERSEFRYREVGGDVSRTYIEWGWRGSGAGDPETAALDLLAIVLGQGRASRLYREVREPGHALSVFASNFATRDIGVFGMSAESRPDDTDRAVRALADSVSRLLRAGVRADELRRARTLLSARLMRRLETTEGQAAFLAEWQALGDWRLGQRYLQSAADVDEDSLMSLARTVLSPDRPAVLVYGPGAIRRRTQAQVAKELFGGRAPDEIPAVAAPSIVPVRRHADFEHEEDGVRFYRGDGVRIAVQYRPGGLASSAVAFAGGSVHESAKEAGRTSLMMRVSTKGTTKHDADALAIASEAIGGSVQAHADADVFHWNMTVPATEITTALTLLTEVAFSPVFPDAAVERERAIALDDVAQVRDDMHRFPLSLMLAAAFPDHAYGFALETLEESLKTVRRQHVLEWHEQRTAGAEPWVVVVGDVDPDEVARSVAGSGRGTAVGPTPRTVPAWPASLKEVHAARDRAQTAIAIGLPGPSRADDDLFPLLLAASAIGGLGGRAFEELRSRRSLAYVVSFRPVARRDAGAFVGYIATSPEREEEAREALLAELARIAEAGVGDDELDRARRYTLGSWDIRRQTTAALAADLVGALTIGKGLDELRIFRDRIRQVAPDDVRDSARRWLDPSRAVIGVVRGKPKRAG